MEKSIKNRNLIIVGIIAIIVILSCYVLYLMPSLMVNNSNSVRTAKIQCQEAAHILSVKMTASSDVIRNYSQMIAKLAATNLVPKENKREFLFMEMETKYQSETALNNLWCTFEPDALDGMDAHFINRVGSDQFGIFSPWFFKDEYINITTDDYAEDFYKIPKETLQEAFSEPYWEKVGEKKILIFSFSAPIISNEKFLGVLGTDFCIEDDLNDLVATEKLVGCGKLITDKGVVVIHDYPEFIGTSVSYNCDSILNILSEEKIFADFFIDDGVKKYKVFVPVPFSEIQKPWLYVIEVPAKQIFAEAGKKIIVTTIILILLVLSIYFYVKIVEANGQLKELHRVKDKFFSVIAHDLRSPIAALLTLLQLTKKNVLDPTTQAQLFKDISTRVNAVHGLLDNLLSWAKSQMQGMVISPVYFDVQKEIRKVMDVLKDVAAAKEIALNADVEPHEVFADPDMFDVVVRNLSSNAIKYTSAGGEVSLKSELSSKMLIVSVKDTGTGIPEEVQAKLFNISETKSQRGTNNESGTGLGLVLCADFVKANGGKIWFTSDKGEGSTFYFSVPLKK